MANKKRAIINATIERMVKEGEMFSTEDVAGDVGCSQSLIFRYYSTKRQLIEACFDEICKDILAEIDRIPFPEKMENGALMKYMVEVWETYYNFLITNRSYARVYYACIARGSPDTDGCRSPESIMRKVFSKNFSRFTMACPEARFVAEYLIVVAEAIPSSVTIGTDEEHAEFGEKIRNVLLYGISSFCGKATAQ